MLRFTTYGAFSSIGAGAPEDPGRGDRTTMYINRALLLVVGVVMIFFPALEDWVFDVETAWYRPFQLWLLVVIASYWNQRSRYRDEL